MARRAKQEDLPAPGMARVERPSVEEPAEDLRAITGEIATLNERKRNAQRMLLEAMVSEGIKIHKYMDPDGVERCARITDDPKVRVERVKGSRKADDGDSSDDAGGVEVS